MHDLTVLERRIAIVKLLQGKEMRIGDLADHFQVDVRTMRADIDALRMGLDVFGTKLRIESKHVGSQKHYYKSTVHPLFLSLNLSELFALLHLLEEAGKEANGQVYHQLFEQVYSQMTDYAEDMLAPSLDRQYDKADIVNHLEEDYYQTDMKYLYWVKSQRFIQATYQWRGEIRTDSLRLLRIQGQQLQVENEAGKRFRLDEGDLMIDWSSQDYL